MQILNGKIFLLTALTSLLICPAPSCWTQAATNGIYATMQTDLGEFNFELFYAKTPRTVANFINLAQGRRAWLDPRTGQVVQKPYYKGIIFHRVIEGFMIQCGSPQGTGYDGPGYRFSDEFDPTLTHDQAGTVSMANKGEDTNGGQIFITTEPTPWLDNQHTVFGEIVDGMEIVSNIATVASDSNDKPLNDIAITNLTIQRYGSAAQAFDPDGVSPALPALRPVTSKLVRFEGSYGLDWSAQTNCEYWVFGTLDLNPLSNWTDLVGQSQPWEGIAIGNLVSNYPSAFLKAIEVEYFE